MSLFDCRWCGERIEEHRSGDVVLGYLDEAGFYNCGKFRRHWPVEPKAVPLSAPGPAGKAET